MTATSNTQNMSSEINVTPMIDILLVLLIIFMVTVPAMPRGEAAVVPQTSHRAMPQNPVILEILKGTGNAIEFRINQQSVTQGELQARLADTYSNRAQRVLFLKGDDRLSFTQIADVIDIGHAAGIDHIGLMTPKVIAGK